MRSSVLVNHAVYVCFNWVLLYVKMLFRVSESYEGYQERQEAKFRDLTEASDREAEGLNQIIAEMSDKIQQMEEERAEMSDKIQQMEEERAEIINNQTEEWVNYCCW